MPSPATPASIAEAGPGEWTLAGCWTGQGIGMAVDLDRQLKGLAATSRGAGRQLVVDGSALQAIDSAGVFLLQQQLRANGERRQVVLRGWPAASAKLMELVAKKEDQAEPPVPRHSPLEQLGRRVVAGWAQGLSLCSFVGESALLFGAALVPKRLSAARPARMLQPLIVAAVERSGKFVAVLPMPVSAAGDFRLETELLRLQQEFLSRPSRIHVTLRATIIDTATRRVVAWRQFDAAVPAASDDPYGGVVAANRALGEVLEQLADFCATVVMTEEKPIDATGGRP